MAAEINSPKKKEKGRRRKEEKTRRRERARAVGHVGFLADQPNVAIKSLSHYLFKVTARPPLLSPWPILMVFNQKCENCAAAAAAAVRLFGDQLQLMAASAASTNCPTHPLILSSGEP